MWLLVEKISPVSTGRWQLPARTTWECPRGSLRLVRVGAFPTTQSTELCSHTASGPAVQPTSTQAHASQSVNERELSGSFRLPCGLAQNCSTDCSLPWPVMGHQSSWAYTKPQARPSKKKRSMRRSAHRLVPNPSSIWLARTIEHDHSTISGAIPNKHPAVFLGPVSKGGTCLEIDVSLEDFCPCLYDAKGMQFYNEIFSQSLYRIKDLQVISIIYRVYS